MAKRRPDEQESDQAGATGNPAMDGDAQYSSGCCIGKSGGACGKEARLTLGGLFARPGDACVSFDYRVGDGPRGAERSQPRP